MELKPTSPQQQELEYCLNAMEDRLDSIHRTLMFASGLELSHPPTCNQIKRELQNEIEYLQVAIAEARVHIRELKIPPWRRIFGESRSIAEYWSSYIFRKR